MRVIDRMKAPVYQQLTSLGRNKLAEMYSRCFESTWETTLQRSEGTVFLVTGDIPAMWLRDSSAQVYHYLPFAAEYPEVGDAICQLMKRQFMYINLDPYANAFNREPSGKCPNNEITLDYVLPIRNQGLFLFDFDI